MVVGAISNIGLASSYSTQDTEWLEIIKKLAALGITSSGSKTVDKTRLEEEIKNQQIQETMGLNKTEEEAETKQMATEEENTELASIFRELHVRQSEDVEYDYRIAIKELRELFQEETDPAQLSRYRLLKDRLDRIMASLGYSTLSIATSEMMGASALGELNKTMMIETGNFGSTAQQ